MPSDLSYWLIATPLKDGDPNVMLNEVSNAIGKDVEVATWEIPELKAGTLSSLLTLSDALPKLDSQFTSTVSKLLDTLRSLVSDDSAKVAQHARVNDRPAEEFLLGGGGGFRWDKGRWGSGGKVLEVVEALTKEINSIDSTQKQKSQSYNLAKGSLTTLQRKQQGNLSQRSLLDVVNKNDLVENSEFMETLIVAVPKNLQKDWADKYERLTNMVVPRSSQRIATDEDYFLQTVTVFKKVKEEFIHKCRENKFIVRDFKWDDSALEKQKKELAELAIEEKELWTELLRLTRINFSEAYQILAHLKTVRLFVESVLRYGLPADYAGVIVKPEPKTAVKTLRSLSDHYTYLASASRGPSTKKTKSGGTTAGSEDVGGEWASVMEAEYYDFVLFEIPKVIT
ncbi:V-type H+-transporting ATPase subunit C [Kwoniella mangroviensis CBS 10435]|uniref:V-type proton ATPase subunit C n=1 Tax=Kwoniella mangroviensis CBS 10435 TaxID=1331196 RepID=A0A1B9ILW6_9TREE|nr:V-type H+-transporting ATPase subunit C [Kwoniella mangroviensis CBS 8507]OCF56477.1 V-type H+-transporting ATPase subunit C [Kwoniella mangroviensis CBS 10435]OCF65211.1 V-type H+-transporting ATPase subunit C [Kwoniella mangroviensis CBS 8507]OCF75048.1 V-type H+-transporting ATPase subunit C [Kwoniella mangroviensis CBS 8886]